MRIFSSFYRSAKSFGTKLLLDNSNSAVLGAKLMRNSPLVKLKPLRKGCRVSYDVKDFSKFDDIRSTCQTGGWQHSFLPITFAQNLHNTNIAFRERVTRDLLDVDESYVDEFCSWALSKKVLHKYFGECREIKHMDLDTVLKRLNSAPGVIKTLAGKVEELKRLQIDHEHVFSSAELYAETKRKAFIKQENLLYEMIDLLDKAPRVIQGAQPGFTLLVSSFIIPFSDRIKTVWNKFSNNVLASGLSNESIGSVGLRLSLFGLLCEDDVSQWDVSIRKKFLIVEREIFRYCGAGRAVLDLVNANIRTHGGTRNGLRYSTPDGRKSGDPYTTIGNSILNVLFHAFIYSDEHNIPIKELDKHLAQMVAGDDNVLSVKLKCDFKSGMKRLGFKSVSTYKGNLWEVDFCSAKFLSVEGGTVLCPNFVRVLMKFGTFSTNVLTDYNELCAVSAKGLYNALSFIPCVRAIFDQYINIDTSKTVIGGGKYDYRLWNSRKTVPNRMTWFELDMQYGIDVRKLVYGSVMLSNIFQLHSDAPNAGF